MDNSHLLSDGRTPHEAVKQYLESIDCPYCPSKIGEPCQTLTGRVLTALSGHGARWEAMLDTRRAHGHSPSGVVLDDLGKEETAIGDCRVCGGDGYLEDVPNKDCPYCRGTGKEV